MISTLVYIDVKPENLEAFKKIMIYNHENSRKESGNIRFDVLQQRDDPCKFTICEVYKDQEAVDFHKTTAHYLSWRDEVNEYMATRRYSVVHKPIAFD